jgi:3-deoxy-D-manno-octulosonate 8-phosphate phosphatase (KDO 8-P phosphatase)
LRAQNLGIQHVYQGIERKLDAMVDLLNKLKLSRDAAAYMGDDVVDLCVMRQVGLSVCVPESPRLVRENSSYVTKRGGGHGAVREACELIMSAQGTLDTQLAQYLK